MTKPKGWSDIKGKDVFKKIFESEYQELLTDISIYGFCVFGPEGRIDPSKIIKSAKDDVYVDIEKEGK